LALGDYANVVILRKWLVGVLLYDSVTNMNPNLPKTGNVHLLASLAAFAYDGLRHVAEAGERRRVRSAKLAEYQKLNELSDAEIAAWTGDVDSLAEPGDPAFASPLRTRLVVPEVDAVFHIASRLAGEQRLLGDEEKSMFRRQLELAATYCGVEVLNFSILDNHFHLLVEVPRMAKRGEFSMPQLFGKIGVLHEKLATLLAAAMEEEALAAPWTASAHFGAAFLRAGVGLAAVDESARDWALRELERHRGLMCCLESFVRILKQRFSIWFNGTHDRFGTLWADRFRSLLVESTPEAVQAVSAYIDLNAVRRGLVDDPADYAFCAAGEARRAGGMGRSGVERVVTFGESASVRASWEELTERHRSLLWGDANGKPRGYGQLAPRLERPVVLADFFISSQPILLDGEALGGGRFVEQIFQANRAIFGANGTRRGDWLILQGAKLRWVLHGLMVLRNSRASASSGP
jgi:putative transposase